ncbi:thiamine phosphate synthase [Sulfurimonas autotrophica]|uniref:Thiamine monophosphate synthase n=1 Tax=Sulfurimonas autotrophica (strain ATCC BAA-671 / DSM 16294 / JCM 11897 / OK10) TaxID=563040 RepID=E0UTV0_SULAO|nr:thiamine phosphate synthase [Sulfurimonas autotrophica]ADN09394.1 thiamine monophosphate synthase [Sulfurimonas autotrophica DSM 16294]
MKKYLITANPSYFQLRKYMPDFALYRDKENKNYADEAQNFVQMCKPLKILKVFLHQDYELAAKLGAHGVHLTSKQFDEIPKAKELGLEVIISTHTHDEVHVAEAMGADYVTYSPVFASPDKGEPKGVEDLQSIVSMTDVKIFALGGIISQKEVDAVANTDAYGFASIRYFL